MERADEECQGSQAIWSHQIPTGGLHIKLVQLYDSLQGAHGFLSTQTSVFSQTISEDLGPNGCEFFEIQIRIRVE